MNSTNSKPVTKTVDGITWMKASAESWTARVGDHAAVLRKRSYGWSQMMSASLQGSWKTLNEAMRALAASVKVTP